MTRLLDLYCRILKVLITLLMVLMIIPVSMQILSRYTGVIPRYIWTEEAARFCFVWIIMIGAILAVRDDTHFDVDLMPAPKTRREQGISKLIVHGSMMLMAVVFIWYGFQFASFGYAQNSEMTGVNMLLIYVSFPIAGASWATFLLEKMVHDVRMIREPHGLPATEPETDG